MKTIITIQHTQSIHHTNGMVGSWTDWELTEQGIIQAQNIGLKLKNELANQQFVMYSSDLLRANQTAQNISKYLDINPVYKKELRERNLGKCCGKSVQWLRENIEKNEQTIDDKMFSDAESRRDEWNRLFPFFNEIITNDEKNIIIVSHGDLLSVFNAMFLGQNITSIDSFELYGLSGGVSFIYALPDGKRYIKRLSDMSYII